MARRKKAEVVAVPENVSLVFLQRRMAALQVELQAANDRVAEYQAAGVDPDLADIQVLRDVIDERDKDLDAAHLRISGLEQKVSDLTSRVDHLEGLLEEQNSEVEEAQQTLQKNEELQEELDAQKDLIENALSVIEKALGREDLNDSVEKYAAFRKLDDLRDLLR